MKQNVSSSLRSIWLSVATLGCIVPFTASGAETSGITTTAGIAVGAEHSDNVTREDNTSRRRGAATPRDDNAARSDIESHIRLNVGLSGKTAQFDTELAYAFTARDYKNNRQTDDESIDGDARILWTPLPDRFAWELTNNVSDSVRNDRLADTLENRRQRNILSTGPNFTFRLSPVDRLSAELRYEDVNVENSDETGDDAEVDVTRREGNGDSERKIGRLRWTHGLSRVSDFLVNAAWEDVKADVDVTFSRLLVGYSARLRSGNYEISIGANRVEPEVGDGFDGSVVQVAYTHDFGGQSLNLTLVKEATDTSVGLGTNSLRSEAFSPRDSNFDSFNIIERQRVDIAYQNVLVCGACTVRAGVFYDEQEDKDDANEQDPLILPNSQTSYGLNLGLVYALRRNLNLLADANFEVIEFVDDPDGLEYDVSEYIFAVNYSVLRDFSIALRVMQFSRDANVEGFDNDELRGGIDFRYSF